jgi:hypothetical protein
MSSFLRAAALVGLLLCLLGSTSCQVGPGPRRPTPADIALRSADAPAGLHRCAASGGIDQYLNWARHHDSTSYRELRQSWGAFQKLGAQAAQVTSYGATAPSCGAGIGRAPGRSAASWVVASADDRAAAAVYRQGVLGFPTPREQPEQPELLVGIATGLGPDAWILQLSSPQPGIYVAWWHDREFDVLLVTLGIDGATSHQMALAMDNRVG